MKSTQPAKPNKQSAAIERFLTGLNAGLKEADKKVKLFWYCRTEDGWRYLPDSPEVRKHHAQGRLMIRERVKHMATKLDFYECRSGHSL